MRASTARRAHSTNIEGQRRSGVSRAAGLVGTVGMVGMAWVVGALTVLGSGPMGARPAMAQGGGGGQLAWAADTFCFPGVGGGTSTLADVVWDACVFDDGMGGGPAVYITGDFRVAGCAKATNIARWDGTSWSALEGPDGEGVLGWSDSSGGGRALAVYDDGSGPALYVGGDFVMAGGRPASNIARWDGSDWSALEGPDGEGIGRAPIAVRDMVVYDDGDGPALYVGGTFFEAGGRPATRIARWDGFDWSPLAGPLGEGVSGINKKVRALAVFDDGDGPALYVAGLFDTAGGRPANRVARWDGTDWSDVGGWQGDGEALALAVYDDGSGAKLYMGGHYDVSGAFNDLARWTGSVWEDLSIDADQEIATLEVVEDGGVRPALYVGGNFNDFNGRDYEGLARYDGEQWTGVGGGVEPGLGGTVRVLLAADDGSGPGVFVGGWFEHASGKQMQSIAKWDFDEFKAMGNAPLDITRVMAAYDDGAGEALYIGGDFLSAGDVRSARVARFDGHEFSPVGGGLPDPVRAMAVYDAGDRPTLYAISRSLYRLDTDGQWEELLYATSGGASAELAVYDDGAGPRLFMGGKFQRLIYADGTFEDLGPMVAFDGNAWSAVPWPYPEGASSIATVRVGDRTDLYASGSYRDALGTYFYFLTRWDGTTWTDVVAPASQGGYYDMVGFDDGAGWALYTRGNLRAVLGTDASQMAKWDGQSWTDIGHGLGDGGVLDLVVHDDGSGPALYAAGSFPGRDEPISRIARWDGVEWTPLADAIGEGLDDIGRVMASINHDDGPALYVGGDFRCAGGVASGGLAKWAVEPMPCRADLDGDGELTLFDFLAFQNAFDAGDLSADFDGDGSLTLFDFLAFQNEFDAGCP